MIEIQPITNALNTKLIINIFFHVLRPIHFQFLIVTIQTTNKMDLDFSILLVSIPHSYDTNYTALKGRSQILIRFNSS